MFYCICLTAGKAMESLRVSLRGGLVVPLQFGFRSRRNLAATDLI